MLVANAINASVGIYDANSGKKLYWLHSYILVVITAYGGGLIAPCLIGKPSTAIGNDLCVPIALVAWYLVHYIPGVYNLVTTTFVKAIWVTLLGLYRTHTVCNIVKLATATLAPGPYYPIPLVGPILVGTILGCAGLFLPADKGLSSIFNGTPWPIQGAFLTATTYQLLVIDKNGFVGNTARAVFGSYSEDTIKVVLATMHISTVLIQTFFANKDANLFTPFHKFFYLFFQVHGPSGVLQKEGTVGWDYRTRILLERCLELSRVLIVLAVIGFHIYTTQKPQSLFVGQRIPIVGSGLATCQVFGNMRQCTPYLMKVEKSNSGYQFVTYKGFNENTSAIQWSLPVSVKSSASNSKIYLGITSDGTTRIIASNSEKQTEEEIWSSHVPKCKPSENPLFPTLSLNSQTGIPEIKCSADIAYPLK